MGSPASWVVVGLDNGGTSNNAPLQIDLQTLVQQWVNGSLANNGVVLLHATPNVPPSYTLMQTSEVTIVANRPRLDVCYSTCSDGIENGSETDLDCGGAACPPCVDGLECLVGSDCASGS